MLNRTANSRRRISNGLAIFGAFLLAASLLSGSGLALQDAEQRADARPQSTEWLAEAESTALAAAHAKKRSFRVSLFLFRH